MVTDEPRQISGEAAHHGGPVILAWDAVVADTRHPGRGRNVVLHEFAHKIDMLDDVIDGTPPLADRSERDNWVVVCTEAFERLRRGVGSLVLRDYAATNPGEFFAVATEVFFTRPIELLRHEPDLYGVLRSFYRQDPAGRLN